MNDKFSPPEQAVLFEAPGNRRPREMTVTQGILQLTGPAD